jgi:glucose-6-phosphate isomerase
MVEASAVPGGLFPAAVAIDGASGSVSPATGHYVKRLSELEGLFLDHQAWAAAVAAQSDPVVYDVTEYRPTGGDVFFGTTVMQPGCVGDEYYMTRGHFHERRDMGEVYYTQSGSGTLLLRSRAGECRAVDMRPGSCAYIPPDWAHRSVNTGDDKLVFVWVCNPQAGHDYGDIREKGMQQRVRAVAGKATVVASAS